MPRAKKDQQNVPTLKKTTGLCPSRPYYAMTYCIDTGQLYADSDFWFSGKQSFLDFDSNIRPIRRRAAVWQGSHWLD